jgi:hypothetical protein
MRIPCPLISLLALGFGAAALAGDLDCPDGTTLEGAAPPGGHKQWCQLPDGTQHGTSLFWYPTGENWPLHMKL